jgi:hypothetical protein
MVSHAAKRGKNKTDLGRPGIGAQITSFNFLNTPMRRDSSRRKLENQGVGVIPSLPSRNAANPIV